MTRRIDSFEVNRFISIFLLLKDSPILTENFAPCIKWLRYDRAVRHQQDVMIRKQERAETSAEIKAIQPAGSSLIAEMVNTSSGSEPLLDKEHQPECEAVESKESDGDIEVFINAVEQEAVSRISDVTHENAVSDRMQSTESTLESANLQKMNTALSEVPFEVNVTTIETEEHSADFKNDPQDQPDLEDPIIKHLGDLDEVDNGTRTTSNPEPQTSDKYKSSPNSYHEHSLGVNGVEWSRMDPAAGDDHPERLTGTILENLEETFSKSEIKLQATEESERFEPPAKKRLRRRMGMCGLGDRKKRFLFDGQYCRQGLLGIQIQAGTLKGNKGVQHLHDTVLENEGTTIMGHEGTTEPACKENEEVLKDKENNGAAVMDVAEVEAAVMDVAEVEAAVMDVAEVEAAVMDVAEVEAAVMVVGVAEIENIYALKNIRDNPLMNDEGTRGGSPQENRDAPKNCILEDNNGTINMDYKGIAKQAVLEHELNLLEDTSTGEGQTPLSPTIGKNVNMIQDEPSIAAATSDHEMETCVEEPKFLGTEMIINGQDNDLLIDVDHKVGEDPDEIATEVEVTQEVSCSSICATVEMSEGSFRVTKEVQEVPTGLEGSEIEIEEHCPANTFATEKPEVSGSDEKGLDPLFVDNMDIAAMAFIDIHNAESPGENETVTDVLESAEPAGGHTNSEPIAPPTGQKNHMQCLLDQNACDTSVTPSVAEQEVCNPTLTPANVNELPQETDLSVPSLLYSMTDSQLHTIALSMELEDQHIPECCDQQEDATELVCGLIRELSSLNRTVMAAHREMELLRRGKLPKAPNRRLCGPRRTEM